MVADFHSEFFAELADVEDRSFWFRARNRLISTMIARYFGDATTMLDVGCGTGYVLRGLHEHLPQLRLSGLDPFEEGLTFARQRVPTADLRLGDARTMEFSDASFDVVGAFDVLEHLDDDVCALRELARVASPDGGIIVTVPQHPRLWSAFDEISEHKRRYTRNELIEKLSAAGLRPLRVTSFMSFLLPVIAASRIRRRQPDPFGDLALPAPLDQVFSSICKAEHFLLAAGVSLPWGASLLATARRR